MRSGAIPASPWTDPFPFCASVPLSLPPLPEAVGKVPSCLIKTVFLVTRAAPKAGSGVGRWPGPSSAAGLSVGSCCCRLLLWPWYRNDGFGKAGTALAVPMSPFLGVGMGWAQGWGVVLQSEATELGQQERGVEDFQGGTFSFALSQLPSLDPSQGRVCVRGFGLPQGGWCEVGGVRPLEVAR